MAARKRRSRQRAFQLGKRLAAYTAAAGGTILAAETGHADINVVTPGSTSVTPGTPFDIDFDGGGAEFGVSFHAGFFFNSAYVFGKAAGNNVALYYAPPFALNVPSGASVGAGLFGSFGGAAKAALGIGYPLYSVAYGKFVDSYGASATGFIGAQFKIGGNTHYGWIQVETSNFDTSSPTPTVDVVQYAYETTPGASIAAGAVPEPNSLLLLACGAAGLAAFRRLKKKQPAGDAEMN